MEWADLPVVDLAKAGTAEGRAELAPQVRDAMRTHGFMYLINHGWTETQVRFFNTLDDCSTRNPVYVRQNERIFDIANVPFEHVPEDEKKQFAGDIKKTGSYRGYKLRNYWVSSDAQFAVFMLFTSHGPSAHRQRCTGSARALQQ